MRDILNDMGEYSYYKEPFHPDEPGLHITKNGDETFTNIQANLKIECQQSICKQRILFLRRISFDFTNNRQIFAISESKDLAAVFKLRENQSSKYYMTRKMGYDFLVEELKEETPVPFEVNPKYPDNCKL